MKIYVFSWNLNSKDADIINKKYLDQILKSKLEDDIILFGFQEMGNINTIVSKLQQYQPLKKFKCHYVATSQKAWHVSAYNIGLFMFIHPKYFGKYKIKKDIKICLSRGGDRNKLAKLICTKGIAGFRVEINKKDYLFLNCHLPVFDINNTRNALKNVKAVYDKHSNKTTKSIVFGDLNSRLHKSKQFNTSKSLTDKEMDISWLTRKKSRFNTLKSSKYKLKGRDLLKTYFDNPFLKKFKEQPINFMPTYKYDTKTGEYDISKENRQYVRVGYADRILYQNLTAQRGSYTPLKLTGSDHMPISISLY